MWLLTAPPRAMLKERYGFDLTDGWVRKAMLGSVRLNNGGSGGFVSADGLIVTNHHVGADMIQKVSPKDRDLLKHGFLARKRSEELKCPDLEINILQEVTDVTERVKKAVKEGLEDAAAAKARRAAIIRIQSEASKKTGLRCDVVELYQGGQYHLYKYRKYTDVRLVWAPEKEVASFGGDVDNFEYPRFNLDVCFFRAYDDDGKPVQPDHFFRWSKTGPEEGKLVVVTGHPGVTNRQDTLAQLKHRRDVTLPYLLSHARMLEALLLQLSARGEAEARMAAKDLARIANRRKVYAGQYAALLNPAILEGKEKDEAAFRKKLGDAEPYRRIAGAMKALTGIELLYALLERGEAFESESFAHARMLVRMSEELGKPDTERLPEYSSSRLPSLTLRLFSPAPIHAELERVKLAGSLAFLAEKLGGEHPLVKKVLAGKSPADRAAELVNGTQLRDVAARKAAAEKLTDDPMIALARAVDEEARAVRKRFEAEVDEPVKQAQGVIAAKRFELFGTSIPPDATFTLRLAFGTVRGYEVDGEALPYATTFAGLFKKEAEQKGREPFSLPKRWLEGKGKLDLATPFNFVSTSDTINGNSGSPVLNAAGDLVGVNFDRNRHGLVRNFVYTDVQARHISVHSRAVLEALRKLYGARELLAELTGGEKE
jgi:hypothetical protein